MPGGEKGQSDLLDCVDLMAWHKYKALTDTGAQSTLMPSRYIGARIYLYFWGDRRIPTVTLLEAEVSLTANKWQSHPAVTGPEALDILGIDYLRKGYFKDPKGHNWAFGIAAVDTVN